MGAMTPVVEAAKIVKEKRPKEKHPFVPTGIPCRGTGRVHMFLKVSGGVGAHSIGSICPSCSISLHDHGDAINERPIELG